VVLRVAARSALTGLVSSPSCLGHEVGQEGGDQCAFKGHVVLVRLKHAGAGNEWRGVFGCCLILCQ